MLNVFSDDKKILKKAWKKVDKINKLSEKYSQMSDEHLRDMTNHFRSLIRRGHTIDEFLYDAFAVVREASKRVKGQYPYDVQLIGGIVMHNGDIAEMKTGEGKTLTAVLPVYLNALEGKGVHVITVNEYLAERDAELNGAIYRYLGLTVGLNKKELYPVQKRQAYKCDITYTTSSELGFDYLRDNMVTRKEDRVLRGLHFALIDEADSVLIDEARTPLIISGGKKDVAALYLKSDEFVKQLVFDEDYEIDIKDKTIHLTEQGITKAEKFFEVKNLYSIVNNDIVHHINQSLKANYIMQKDIDYVVDTENDEIVIVDSFTGRLMPGRAYSDGLHQAIEAKEGITIKNETTTIATIIYQNFFRLYDKLAGMTGTAKTDEDELLSTYNMRVIQIPTNKPVIRQDLNDELYATKKAKFNALLEEVQKLHTKGQPILIGTADIETSEYLSKRLDKLNIAHNVLNAKNHAQEAQIIANAGVKFAVTIATNMAGRGTDIKLGDGVRELGGLAVLGSERHESRRIDDQLRGRSGRQGDPGFSKFYVSMEDDMMLRYGSDKAKFIAKTLGNESMNSKLTSRTIKMAQEQIEGINYDIRKNVLQYDEVLRQQRNTIYGQRNYILENENIHSIIKGMFNRTISYLVSKNAMNKFIDKNALKKDLKEINFEINEIPTMNAEDLTLYLENTLWQNYEEKITPLGDYSGIIEKQVALQITDFSWTKHIDTMDKLRRGIGLRAYAQNNPVEAYTKEGFDLFSEMINKISFDVTRFCMRMKVIETE